MDLKIWDDEQPKATYPPLEKPIDKRLFWCDPPYYWGEPKHQMTEKEYIQKMVDNGAMYCHWYANHISVLAESLGLVCKAKCR